MKALVFRVILAFLSWSSLILSPSAWAMDKENQNVSGGQKRPRKNTDNNQPSPKRTKKKGTEMPPLEESSLPSNLSSPAIQSWQQYEELRTNVSINQWRQQGLGPGFEKEAEPEWGLSDLNVDKLLPEEVLYHWFIFYERVKAQNLFRFGGTPNDIPAESSDGWVKTVIARFNTTALEDPGSSNLFSILQKLPPSYGEEVKKGALSFSSLALDRKSVV